MRCLVSRPDLPCLSATDILDAETFQTEDPGYKPEAFKTHPTEKEIIREKIEGICLEGGIKAAFEESM